MTEADLPHRAKPELLHEISRLIRENGGRMDKSEIYSRTGDNQKTVRRTLQYGALLGFLEEEEEGQYRLTGRGSGLAYSPNMDGQEAVMDIFREAIESYRPYREAVASLQSMGKIRDVNDVPAVIQDDFREQLQRSVGTDVEDREVNLLIKTAQAAGLGQYKAGRRGYQTRLVVNEDFEHFGNELAEKYSLPSEEPDEKEDTDEEAGEPDGTDEEQHKELVQESITESFDGGAGEADGRTVTHVHVHVWAENEDDAMSLVDRIREGKA